MRSKQTRLFAMTDFMPRRIFPPYQFDIRRDRRGFWIARDRSGLTGGTFLTHKDALHFALFETGGDASHIHEAGTTRHRAGAS